MDPDEYPLWIAAHEAPRWTGVSAGTVRSWASRRRLLPRGLDDDGRPLYATAEIVRMHRSRPERCAS